MSTGWLTVRGSALKVISIMYRKRSYLNRRCDPSRHDRKRYCGIQVGRKESENEIIYRKAS